MIDPALRRLADHFGIATEFTDWQGRQSDVSADTVRAVLRALDVEVTAEASATDLLAELELGQWRRMLPPCVVTRSHHDREFRVHVPHDDPVIVTAVAEGREHACPQRADNTPPRDVDGVLTTQASFTVPQGLPYGYHRLVAVSGDLRAEVPLIITPDRLGTPASLGDDRVWGLVAQLYSVRSAESWGMGDTAVLRDLAAWTATEHDADFLLVNPMHAAEPRPPVEPSPYLPTTRRFPNPLYLRVADIPEFADLDSATRSRIRELQATLDPTSERIDRDAVWRAKDAALRLVFRTGLSPDRDAAFTAFRQREGADLAGYATWCAIATRHGADWQQWPDPLQDPTSAEVAAYPADHTAEVDYHAWLQWHLDEQLARAQAAAIRAGMRLGVVHDLAVGVNPRGAEAWARGDVFARGVSVGAPPDAFNRLGQDWGQPPWRPDRLAELAYQPFRDMVAGLLRHAGGIRVDHIIGLFRLWWVPEGAPPTTGTYVRYDHEALIGILALEAWLAGAVIIGEDLGTVEPWVRDHLAERGLLGTSILWFERDYAGDGQPLAPEQWRAGCLASVTTHDLPPAAGYLTQAHVRLRHELGLLGDDLTAELAADRAEQDAWRDALVDLGLLTADASDEDMVIALHRYLARTPARLRGVALVDAVGDHRIQNQPGTSDEYPNWRIPLSDPDGIPMLLEQVRTSTRFTAVIDAVRDHS